MLDLKWLNQNEIETGTVSLFFVEKVFILNLLARNYKFKSVALN